MSIQRSLAPLAIASLLLAACGGDDSADDADTTSTTVSPTTTVAQAGGETGGDGSGGGSGSTESTNAPEGPDAGAEGSATFTAGDISFDAVIVECTLAEPDVSFVAEGENAGFQVTAIGGGEVDVFVQGVVEWEGRGTATITGGDISIVGAGSAPDDSASVEDFSIDAQIDAC